MQFNTSLKNRSTLALSASLAFAAACVALDATARADEGEAHTDIWVYSDGGALRTLDLDDVREAARREGARIRRRALG